MADFYIITVSLSVDESESTFTTSSTSIKLSLQPNQDYNVSVVASNCAGNSSAAFINVRIGIVIRC